jgi:hypothetical protein
MNNKIITIQFLLLLYLNLCIMCVVYFIVYNAILHNVYVQSKPRCIIITSFIFWNSILLLQVYFLYAFKISFLLIYSIYILHIYNLSFKIMPDFWNSIFFITKIKIYSHFIYLFILIFKFCMYSILFSIYINFMHDYILFGFSA